MYNRGYQRGGSMGLNSQKMNLDYIRTFVVLAQSSNMTEASRKLEVNVSYVSRHLKQLEDELGTRLVIPSPKNKDLQLTEAGKFFFERYEKIYNATLLAEKEYKQTLELDNCKITIGICSDLENAILKPKMRTYMNQFPNISMKIINGNTEELSKKLTQYAVDIIIDKNVPISNSKLQEIDTKVLCKSNYCIAYNKNYFKDNSNIKGIPLILPINGTQERATIDEYFDKTGTVPNIKYEIENTDRIISYLKDGFGAGIVLKESIKDINELSYTDIDIQNDITVSFIKDKLTPSTKEFLKLFNVEL